MGATTFYLLELERQEKEKSKQLEKETQEPVIEEYETFERDQLKKVNNDLLKARLDQLEVEYHSNAVKKDLINLLVGEEPDEEPEDNNNQEGEQNGEGETIKGNTEGQETQEEQTEEQKEK
jgi:hypothetical protein